jgi:hypothetical protein
MAKVLFLALYRYFLFSVASRLALEPMKPPIQWVLGAISQRAKWWEYKTESPLSSAEVKDIVALPLLPYISSWHND